MVRNRRKWKCGDEGSAGISGVPEIILHFWSAGNYPALLECRKFSCTSGVPEIFLHFWSAGNFPALLECRKFSCTSGVPEIFLHFWSAGNFPAFLECRKFSCISGSFIEFFLSASVHLYIINHFCSTLVPTLFSFSICMSTFVGHMFLHFSIFSIYMSTFVGHMFLHFSIYMSTFVGRMFLYM